MAQLETEGSKSHNRDNWGIKNTIKLKYFYMYVHVSIEIKKVPFLFNYLTSDSLIFIY